MKHANDVITVAAIVCVFGFLILATLGHLDVGNIAMLAAASIIAGGFFVVAACIIYSDRLSFVRRYRRAFENTEEADGFIAAYKATWKAKIALFASISVIIVMLSLITLYAKQNWVDFGGMIDVIIGHLQGMEYPKGDPRKYADILICDDRLPRVICIIAGGASLAVGGCVMQSVVKNPLADPYTTGISSGAVFGVAIAMIIGFSINNGGHFGVIINAFVFSLVPTAVLILISKMSNGSVVTVVLVGTAISYIFASLTTVIMIGADETQMDQVFKWQVGSLEGMTWTGATIMTAFFVVCGGTLALMSGKLNVMSAGDSEARSLGMNSDRFRAMCLVLISLMTAAVISFTGIIGFLGLLCPHIVRMIVGSDNKAVIPTAAALGAAMLLFADLIARNIATDVMPVGVVMSFIGGPLFLILLLRSKRGAWY